MRAGKLDRIIRLDRYTEGVPDDYGNAVPTWEAIATVRAQLLQSSTEEFMRSYGISDETVVVFRTRYIAGITTADRVHYQGAYFGISEVKEIGRRKGLELRCSKVGAGSS